MTTRRGEGTLDLFELIRTAIRRWYVVLPVLVASGVGAVLILQAASEEYELEASYLLSGLSLDGELPGGPTEVEGITDAGLLADVLNLDGRAGPATDDPSQANFEASTIGDTRLRIDVYGDDPVETLQLLEEQLEQADQAVADEVVFEVLARPDEATPSNEVRGEFQASALLRVDDTGSAIGGPIGGGYASRIVGELMSSSQAEADVLARGPEGTYVIERSDRDGAPIMAFTVVSDSEEAVSELLAAVVEVAAGRLELLQVSAGVSEDLRLELVPLAQSEPASLGIGEGRRPAVAVVALGVVVAFGLAVAIDGVSRRRSAGANGAHESSAGWDDESATGRSRDGLVGREGLDGPEEPRLDDPRVRSR